MSLNKVGQDIITYNFRKKCKGRRETNVIRGRQTMITKSDTMRRHIMYFYEVLVVRLCFKGRIVKKKWHGIKIESIVGQKESISAFAYYKHVKGTKIVNLVVHWICLGSPKMERN